MAAPTVYVEAQTVQALLTRAMLGVSPPSMLAWLNASVDPYLRQRASSRFASEGDDASGKWAGLQASTLSFRAAGGFPPTPINRRTGELEAYITGSPSRTEMTMMGANLTFPGSPPSGWLATKVATAQEGKSDPATVARPVLAVSATDVSWTLTSMAQWIGQYIMGKTPMGGPRK